jgi:16S rRNA (uracil1498-N3)-methyltransferase
VTTRRVHTPRLRTGEIELDPAVSRHVRNVLRLDEGSRVEVFDDAGAVASGEIIRLAPAVVVRVGEAIAVPGQVRPEMIIASAVPKGERADWMVEKLSELGCSRFIPLATARSVVHPGGKNKQERWTRLATEAARQSRRAGVMRIDELTPLSRAIDDPEVRSMRVVVLSTDPGAAAIAEALRGLSDGVALFIGPEGGWTTDEIQQFSRAGVVGLRLTETILRIETAAVAAAAVVAVLSRSPGELPDADGASNPDPVP